MYRNHWLQIRMTEAEVQHLDDIRGEMEKSAYVRGLLAAQQAHRHARDMIVRTERIKGAPVEVWRCACGKELK